MYFFADGITKIVDTTFSVEHEAYGAIRTHELKKGGKDISVTESNKREYVRLYVNYRWCHGIEQQFLALQKGFNEVLPQHHLKPFDERELELVIGNNLRNLKFVIFAHETFYFVIIQHANLTFFKSIFILRGHW